MQTAHRNRRLRHTIAVAISSIAIITQTQCTVGDDPNAEPVVLEGQERGDYTGTRYPIVLMHGLSGFDSIGGLVDYFHKVPYNLERSGARVYIAQVSAFNDSETRGEQLADFIVANVAESKVNILGHSQGAPTARVAASFIPDRIASITSISGANKGSKVADMARGIIPPDSTIEGGAALIVNTFARLLDLLSAGGEPQDALAALDTLTTPGAEAVNSRHPWGLDLVNPCGYPGEDVDVLGYNVKMFSWVGTDTLTSIFDLSDPLLMITALAFGDEPNDGLVGQCSQYLGEVVYDNQDMNHMDSVNHMFGIHSLWLDPISLYRRHANRLKNRGL